MTTFAPRNPRQRKVKPRAALKSWVLCRYCPKQFYVSFKQAGDPRGYICAACKQTRKRKAVR